MLQPRRAPSFYGTLPRWGSCCPDGALPTWRQRAWCWVHACCLQVLGQAVTNHSVRCCWLAPHVNFSTKHLHLYYSVYYPAMLHVQR